MFRVKAAGCAVQRKQPVHSGLADVKVCGRFLERGASPLTEGEDAFTKVEGERSRHHTVRSRRIANGIGRSIDGRSAVQTTPHVPRMPHAVPVIHASRSVRPTIQVSVRPTWSHGRMCVPPVRMPHFDSLWLHSLSSVRGVTTRIQACSLRTRVLR